jgi:uncharacterized protein YjbI with pentapeptide repeats
MRSTISRLVPALAAAAVVAIVQAWGWGDAARTLAAGAGWLWRVSWPIVRVAALPLTAAWVLYVTTSAGGRRWWRRGPWRVAGRTARRGWLPLAVAGIVVLLTGLVLLAPGWLVARDTTGSTLIGEQRAKATSDARTALLQAVGGLLLAAGALATWRQVRISREGQVTERFTRAVEQLGSEHLDVRLGALYALERIARDSAGDRRTIAEILTAYIRQRAPWPPTQPGQAPADWPLDEQRDLRTRATDVQAALTILGRGAFPKPVRLIGPDPDRFDLRDVDLRKADLAGAHLEGADLSGAHLEEAHLGGAHLKRAWLHRAHLEGAWLVAAHLEEALLPRAHLEGTRLEGAHLERAKVFHASLQGAQLIGTYLQGADLSDANLEGAWLSGAHLQKGWLGGAYLKRAKLGRAQLEGARASAATVWPEGFAWRAAGVIEAHWLTGEPIGADQQAAMTDMTAGPAKPGAAMPAEREYAMPDEAQRSTDGDLRERREPHRG